MYLSCLHRHNITEGGVLRPSCGPTPALHYTQVFTVTHLILFPPQCIYLASTRQYHGGRGFTPLLRSHATLLHHTQVSPITHLILFPPQCIYLASTGTISRREGFYAFRGRYSGLSRRGRGCGEVGRGSLTDRSSAHRPAPFSRRIPKYLPRERGVLRPSFLTHHHCQSTYLSLPFYFP